MSFLDRVKQAKDGWASAHRAKVASKIDDIDDCGDPVTVASTMVNMSMEKEIGRITGPRASALYQDCMRLRVLGVILKRKNTAWLSLPDRVIFGIGSAIHWWMQNTPDVFGRRRVGWWRCLACNSVLYFGYPPKKKCSKCGARSEAIHYEEHGMAVQTEELMLTGHPDMFWEKAKGVWRVLEFKSISGDMFPNLKAPLIDHQWQIQMYMHGLQYDTNLPIKIDGSVGYVVYISKKDTPGRLPLKAFPVKRDEDLIERATAKVNSFMEGVKKYPEDVPSPHTDCVKSEFQSYRANTCPVKKECAELREKGGITDDGMDPEE